MSGLNIGIVGATGVVGQAFIKLIESRKFSLASIKPFASERSEGEKLKCNNKDYAIESLSENCFNGLDVVFFSSGDSISKEWAPKAQAAGAVVIDNSASFRMSRDHKLIVPEINGNLLGTSRSAEIIANPNCSTIQLVMVLNPLKLSFGISEVKVASYQSVSGAGKAAIDELKLSTALAIEGKDFKPKEFSKPIAFNTIPQIGSFEDNGFCTEELKIINETRKILDLPKLNISAFTVRVPTQNSHAEVAWVTLEKEISEKEILSCLGNFPGLNIYPNWKSGEYPDVLSSSGTDAVHVGRIHRDLNNPKTWLTWIVSDNLLKGAALNGIQIAEKIFF